MLTHQMISDEECIAYRKKEIARRGVDTALKEGKLKRPEHGKLDAHHVDYGSPLNVYWLCRTCHGVVHKKNHPLNPKNHRQTPSSLQWKGNEYQVVSFAIPFENFIMIKKLAEERNLSVPKFLRAMILKDFPVENDLLTPDVG